MSRYPRSPLLVLCCPALLWTSLFSPVRNRTRFFDQEHPGSPAVLHRRTFLDLFLSTYGERRNNFLGIETPADFGVCGRCRSRVPPLPGGARGKPELARLGDSRRGCCGLGPGPLAVWGSPCPNRNECDASLFCGGIWLEG